MKKPVPRVPEKPKRRLTAQELVTVKGGSPSADAEVKVWQDDWLAPL